MKKRITYTINNNNEKIRIPDLVNEKCNAAYEVIRAEAPPVKSINHKKKATIIAIAAAAAIACSGTVAATYFRDASNFTSKEVYVKDPAKKMDYSAYADIINTENKQSAANMTLQSIYCDGENLSISFMLTPNDEELKKMTGITANAYVRIDDVLIKDTQYLSFFADENGVFYGTICLKDLEIKDASKLNISISAMQGYNYKHQTWVPSNPNDYYNGGTWTPDSTDYFKDKFVFDETIKVDTSNNKLYEINETKNGVTLESIYVTPFATTINLNGLEDGKSIEVIDQDGNKLEWMEYRCTTPPLKTSKQLNIRIFDLYTDNFPTEEEFTVNIEKGFADKYTVEYDNSDIVYDPPQEEFDEYWEKKNEENSKTLIEAAKKVNVIPVNTAYDLQEYDCAYIDEHIDDKDFNFDLDGLVTINYKITGSNIGEVNYSQVDEDHLNWCKDVYKTDDYKMLYVDYELTNTTDRSCSINWFGLDTYTKNFDFSVSEPDYQSYKDNGGKSSYNYDFEPNQTKKITLGYIIPADKADSEFYALAYTDKSKSYEFNAKALLDGKCQLMEIK